jgi:hypothetical protein
MWFIVSNAWVPPPRLTATTDAPIFPRKNPPLATATKPDRSSKAFISALTSVKIKAKKVVKFRVAKADKDAILGVKK